MNGATHYHIVIVGGGMVGSALACALAQSPRQTEPLHIAIVEGRDPPGDWPAEGFDLRVSAITRASQQLFQQLGAWQAMCESRVSAYREMQVWDAGGQGQIHFDSAEIGEAELGHIIENRVITRALAQRAASHDNIHLYCPARAKSLRLRSDGRGELQLANGDRLKTGLIIGADGGNSWVRQQAGIQLDVRHYRQQALVCTVKTELYHQETAWQRFLPSGPLAFLPLSNGYSSIVWSTSPEQAAELLAMDEEIFRRRLGEAFAHRLGAITELGTRACFPLQGQHARQYVKPGLALIGDAAHTIHPLAGQGVNLGFADVRSLAQILLEAHAQGKNPGALNALRRYERSRRGANQLTLEAMGIFKQVFSNDSAWLAPLRNRGLQMADNLPPLKRFFMRQAMGMPVNPLS